MATATHNRRLRSEVATSCEVVIGPQGREDEIGWRLKRRDRSKRSREDEATEVEAKGPLQAK